MTLRVPSYVPEGLLLFAVVFGPLAFGATEPWSRSILEVDLFLLFATCALRDVPLSENPVYKTLLPAFLLLLCLGVLQRLNSRLPTDPTSLFPSTSSARATGRELLLWASYASLLWSTPQVLAQRGAARRLAWTVFLLGAFIAVVGIVQRAQGNTAYYGFRPIRQGLAFGPYVNRDHAASMMVMSALVGMGLLLSGWMGFRELSGGEQTDVIASQGAALFLLGIVLFAIVSSGSRGAFNSLFASLWITGLLATVFIQGRRNRWVVRTVAVLGVPAYFFFLWLNPLWIGYVLKTPDLSTAFRLSMYRGVLILLRDLPVWGAGLGALQSIYPVYQEHFVSGIVDHLHSDWLEFVSEMGLAGAIVAVAGFATFFRANLRDWGRNTSRVDRCMTGGVCAAMIAFLLHEAVDFSFHIPANAVIFLTLACLFGGCAPVLSLSASRSPGKWRVFSLGVVLLLSLISIRPAVSWSLLNSAESAPITEKGVLMTRALRWDDDPNTRSLLTAYTVTRADAQSAASAALLNEALWNSESAVSSEPLDSWALRLKGAVLWRLGRTSDAQNFIERSKFLGD